jgi:hypothetical protein
MPAMDSGIFEGECQQDDKPGNDGLNTDRRLKNWSKLSERI